MFCGWQGGGGWAMGMGWLGMLLFWGLVLAGILALGRTWARTGPGSTTGETRGKTARDIVQERYARGEIDRGEFEQKMRDLAQ